MLPYFITLLVYIVLEPIFFFFTKSIGFAVALKLSVMIIVLYYYRKLFKFKVKLDYAAILLGILIAAIWIGLDPFYFHINKDALTYSFLAITLKLISGVVIAPIIEEFFTRFFLVRWIVNHDYKSVPLGKFTVSSFLVTVFFFGFSHERWLAGLITGILLNLLFYYRKNIGSCVLAHAVANLALGIYVIYFGQFQFW